MELTSEQRRSMVALACKVAWADGHVTDEERDHVRVLARRFAVADIQDSEVDRWLDMAPPEAEIQQLPESLGQLFFYEAMRIMEADGDLADSEMEMLETIMERVFKAHPDGTPLARIALRKRPAG